MGAPAFNKNHQRHGLKSSALPRGCSYIVVATNQLRRALEGEVLHAFGEVNIFSAALAGPLNRLLLEVIDVQRSSIRNVRTESVAEILTTDSKGTHGSRPDVVLIDELSHVGSQEFAETLADNLDKMPHGLMLVATNAGFVESWQHAWRNIAVASPRWYFSTYKQPAPWIDPADLVESKQRNSAARYARLWAGEWVRDGGDALDGSDIEAARCDRFQPRDDDAAGWQRYRIDHTFIGGLDLSTRRDHSALCILATSHQNRRIHVAHCQSWKPIAGKVDLPTIRQAVLDAHRRYRTKSVHFDQFQCDLMAADLRRENLHMVEQPFVGQNLNRMASKLIETFRSRQIDIPPGNDKLLGDLARLTIVERSFGYKLDAVRDAEHGHADTAFALAIALPAALEASGQVPFKAYRDADGVISW